MPGSTKHQIWISEYEWELIQKLINEKITQSKGLIKRAKKYPSETIRSSCTIDKHLTVIDELEIMENNLAEQLQY